MIDPATFRYLADKTFWSDLWRKINQDDCWGRAAQASYYFLLAFFPFLIFLSALIGFLPVAADLITGLLTLLRRFLPQEAYVLVREIAEQLLESQNTGVLSLGVVLALWSASLGFSGLVGVLNRAYQVREHRSYLHIHLLSMLVTVAASLTVVVAHVFLFFGSALIHTLVPAVYASGLLVGLLNALRWILIFVFLNFGIQILFSALPARRFPWKLFSPGGLAASIGWVFGSMGFTFYIDRAANYQRLYGGLGTFVVLLLWFYVFSFFLLLGGEIDAVIHRRKREHERVPF
ncbi:MAG: YihY/virulence factor BrkB family protein [Acidobacteria bacterium]|nr:YihY/virulence factor BrkB family protein [Acidobacteriota bacterium]